MADLNARLTNWIDQFAGRAEHTTIPADFDLEARAAIGNLLLDAQIEINRLHQLLLERDRLIAEATTKLQPAGRQHLQF